MVALLAAVVLGAAGSIAAVEFLAWSDRLVRKLIALAAHLAGAEYGERLHEEWLAHRADLPGHV